jgi:hypothetical protein
LPENETAYTRDNFAQQREMKLGIIKSKAWEFANTRKGYWHTANSPILSQTISNERFKQAGYIFFTDYYLKVAPAN